MARIFKQFDLAQGQEVRRHPTYALKSMHAQDMHGVIATSCQTWESSSVMLLQPLQGLKPGPAPSHMQLPLPPRAKDITGAFAAKGSWLAETSETHEQAWAADEAMLTVGLSSPQLQSYDQTDLPLDKTQLGLAMAITYNLPKSQ